MLSSSILTMKILLISSGVVSLAMAVKFTVLPFIVNFTVSELPTVWSALFKPPYLFVVINGIIITIAASSRFSTHCDSTPSPRIEHSQPLISAKTPPPVEISHAVVFPAAPMIKDVELPMVRDGEVDMAVVYEDKAFDVKKPVMENGLELLQDYVDGEEVRNEPVQEEDVVVEVINEDEEEVEVVNEAMSTYAPPSQTIASQETEAALPSTEKPPRLSRFGPRKSLEASPDDGRKLRAAKPNKTEATLESTWRMITEGHHEPLTRQMKKADTFVKHERNVDVTPTDNYENYSAPQNSYVRKSETFKDRTGYLKNSEVSAALLRKEPSLGQEELNRRAEAFIKKFNEEMRMQRQESLKQYMEMINRGAH